MAYQLVFEELFNEGKLNASIWTEETGGHGFGNKESQFYTTGGHNLDFSKGYLSIIGRKEEYQDNHYTSAKITTYPNYLFHYGKLEVKATLPIGHGTWPAIWLLGENFKKGTPWPKCGEIDLMEHVGHHEGFVHVSLHTQDHHFTLGTQQTAVKELKDPFEPHTYTMIWDESGFTFEIDHEPIQSFKKPEVVTENNWPFDQPFYLIMNIALGGTWGGPIDDLSLPVHMDIHSIKYFKEVK
jgi:beta-glucanase (GH16 family)